MKTVNAFSPNLVTQLNKKWNSMILDTVMLHHGAQGHDVCTATHWDKYIHTLTYVHGHTDIPRHTHGHIEIRVHVHTDSTYSISAQFSNTRIHTQYLMLGMQCISDYHKGPWCLEIFNCTWWWCGVLEMSPCSISLVSSCSVLLLGTQVWLAL